MEYDKRGNIPGPTRWQSEEDEAVLNKENIWIDSAREGTVDLGNQLLDTLKYGGAVKGGIKLPKVPKLPPSSHKTINITPKDATRIVDDIVIRRTDQVIPRSTSSSHIYKDSNISVKKGGLLDPNRVNPIEMYSTGVDPERTGKVSKSDIPLKKSIFEGAAITNVEELDRAAAALVQRRTGTLSGVEFNKWTKEATADLQQTYKHITSGELNAHHNNIIKSGVSLHEGRTGPESMLIESWLLNKGVASGNNPLNNNLVPEQVHGLVHRWMNERIGKKYLTGLIGELNSPERKQWEQLPIDHPDVKKVVEQYADYVNGATERTAELMQAYYKIWGPESQITTSTLEELYTKLGINELEYNQLIKPGLSGKDARMFAQGYGPKKIKITWADGTTETIYERLLDELNNDPQLAAKIDALNRPQVKVGDFSNEPTSLTPAQQRVKRWNDEYGELTSMKKEGIKLTRAEKKRMKELKGLIYYQPDIPGMLFQIFDERVPKEGPFNESHGGWRYKK